jgi:hypothetical protein
MGAATKAAGRSIVRAHMHALGHQILHDINIKSSWGGQRAAAGTAALMLVRPARPKLTVERARFS